MKKLFFAMVFVLGMSLAAGAQNRMQDKGYMGIFQAGYGFGVGGYQYKSDRVGFSVINGYKFSPYLYLGGGVGMNCYIGGLSKDLSMPVFLYLRSEFLPGKVSPFLSMSCGYNIPLPSDGSFAGLTLEPAIGVSFRLPNYNRLFVSFSCAMDQIKDYGYYAASRKELTAAINFKFGLTF